MVPMYLKMATAVVQAKQYLDRKSLNRMKFVIGGNDVHD